MYFFCSSGCSRCDLYVWVDGDSGVDIGIDIDGTVVVVVDNDVTELDNSSFSEIGRFCELW
jgi:endogenous inhibitor of DNA gyrase (YacG/DUF329 family)